MRTLQTINGHFDQGPTKATGCLCICALSCSQLVGDPHLCSPPSFPHRTAGLLSCRISYNELPEQTGTGKEDRGRACSRHSKSPGLCLVNEHAHRTCPHVLRSAVSVSIPCSVLRSSRKCDELAPAPARNLADCPFRC